MNKKTKSLKETFALAFQNHQKNNFEIAEKLYKEILEIDNNHFQSIFLLGLLSAQTKNFDKSKKLLNQAVKINPKFTDAQLNLGNIFQKLGQLNLAVNCYLKVLIYRVNIELMII